MIKKLLTSNYDKSELSNVSKISKVISDELEELKQLFGKIESTNDIDLAEGKQLDDLGSNILQYRGEVNDELYRVLIKSKIARNKANGTLNNLLDVLALSLRVDKSTIKMIEGVNPLFYSISIVDMPIDVLASIGMTVLQLGRLIRTMVAAGVKLESIIFTGTFEYTDVLSNNLSLGYADVDMLNGGTLGDVYVTEKDTNFPL